MSDPWRIESEDQINETLGHTSEMVRQKIFDHVDEYSAAFIARSPLLLLATSDRSGRLDVSPKGDGPGFVVLDDERTLLLPERPGNKLAFGFRNILENPRVGMVFLVPGTTETLRANGTAEITRDPGLLERLSAKGKPALLVTRITVEECFFHCGKAFIRSGLWKPESWPQGYRVNLGRQLAKKMGGNDEVAERIDEGLEQSYKTTLY
ncbi:MAG: MSMEG_1061 family FMN-dependent PPOX-type flavoprotein [Candidatus Binatia bacterium]